MAWNEEGNSITEEQRSKNQSLLQAPGNTTCAWLNMFFFSLALCSVPEGNRQARLVEREALNSHTETLWTQEPKLRYSCERAAYVFLCPSCVLVCVIGLFLGL